MHINFRNYDFGIISKAVDKAGGRVTVADVARLSGLDLREASKNLNALATLTEGSLEVCGKD